MQKSAEEALANAERALYADGAESLRRLTLLPSAAARWSRLRQRIEKRQALIPLCNARMCGAADALAEVLGMMREEEADEP